MTSSQIEKYKPYLYLAKGEKYEVTHVEDYINMSKFLNSEMTFDEAAKSKNNGKGLVMVIKDEFKNTYKTMKTKNPPVYVIVNKKGNKKQIVYLYFYNYNGPKDVLGFIPIGAHTADIEWTCIELHDNKPKYVILGRHGKNSKFDYDTFNKDGTHVIVYSSINGHATYEAPGTYIRFLGFGNDICSRGKKIVGTIKRIKKNSSIAKYKGKMGNHIDSFNRFIDVWLRKD